MQSITTVNIDLLIVKLQMAYESAEGTAFAPPVKAALFDMAVRGLEQQKKEIERLRAQAQPTEHIGLAVGQEVAG